MAMLPDVIEQVQPVAVQPDAAVLWEQPVALSPVSSGSVLSECHWVE
jgi:hypothetical protein